MFCFFSHVIAVLVHLVVVVGCMNSVQLRSGNIMTRLFSWIIFSLQAGSFSLSCRFSSQQTALFCPPWTLLTTVFSFGSCLILLHVNLSIVLWFFPLHKATENIFLTRLVLLTNTVCFIPVTCVLCKTPRLLRLVKCNCSNWLIFAYFQSEIAIVFFPKISVVTTFTSHICYLVFFFVP